MVDPPSKRIEELFHAALERNPEERACFLDAACAGDAGLREEVEALLAMLGEAADYFDRPEWAVLRPQAAGDDALPPGLQPEEGLPFERLGEFRLIRRLGEGGMGVVYLAVQESLDRQVALKVIRPEQTGSREAETRFAREVELAAGLRHANIVAVHASGEQKGVRYFAMEYVPGESLNDVLRRAADEKRQLPLRTALGWFHDIAAALDCAHKAGVIHRDVKPSNVRITPEGRAMLMDFGVARHVRLATLTLTGAFRGTPHYASPEQVRARSTGIDHRTDVYSLGASLYEAMTGQVPFQGETTEQVFHQILVRDPLPPRRLNPSLSRDVETAITTAMEKDPGRRYQTMAAFQEDLRRLLAGEPVVARPPGWVRKTVTWFRRRWRSSAVAALLLIVVASLVFYTTEVWRYTDEQTKLARKHFKPLPEALEQPDLLVARNYVPWAWCLEADPEDPSGYVLRALYLIAKARFEEAAEDLATCARFCRERGEARLQRDTTYLLGLVHLAMSEGPASEHGRRADLLEQARIEFEAAGEFEPASHGTLVWRVLDPAALSAREAREALETIVISSEHYFVHLCIGLYFFAKLHRGGEILEYKKAFNYFEKALERRPDSVMVLTFLGRTYYIFARFYDFLHLCERSQNYLQRAHRLAGDRPSHLVLNTLGAICLLSGDDEAALEYNRAALAQAEGEAPGNVHNVYSCIGRVCARQQRIDEAFEWYGKALALHPDDVATKIAMAELFLNQNETGRALEVAPEVDSGGIEPRAGSTSTRLHPSAYLLRIRIRLERGEYDDAARILQGLLVRANKSPRDFGVACILAATFPDEWLNNAGRREKTGMLKIVASLAWEATHPTSFEGQRPPICFTAQAVTAWLSGQYETAISRFERAIRTRLEWWPREMLEYHWTENARDLYFLAMAHFRLAGDPESGAVHAEKARACFEEAEEEWRIRSPPVETADIIKRVRAKAREVLAAP